ncbi:hypothetical protein TYRP_018085 [Tyrophagus putrescentiae]|nr:hypothetical protein TYRP_018085 [Tyrophagus putrescentiae]
MPQNDFREAAGLIIHLIIHHHHQFPSILIFLFNFLFAAFLYPNLNNAHFNHHLYYHPHSVLNLLSSSSSSSSSALTPHIFHTSSLNR